MQKKKSGDSRSPNIPCPIPPHHSSDHGGEDNPNMSFRQDRSSANQRERENPLTPPVVFCSIVGTSLVFNQMKAEPEFHAEWLRDEPYDATATDPGSYIPGAWCQLSPGNREHGIRNARIV